MKGKKRKRSPEVQSFGFLKRMFHLRYLMELFSHLDTLQNHRNWEWTKMLVQKSLIMEHTGIVWNWCIAATPEKALYCFLLCLRKWWCYMVTTYNVNVNKLNCYSVYTVENLVLKHWLHDNFIFLFTLSHNTGKFRQLTLV